MENHSPIIRTLINELLRSLSAALVHVNDLIMKVERNSDLFPDAILTNEQLSRSIELFLDLRSECYYLLEQLLFKHRNSTNESTNLSINADKPELNDLFSTVLEACGSMLLDFNKKKP